MTQDEVEAKLARTITRLLRGQLDRIMAQAESGTIDVDWIEEENIFKKELRPLALDGFGSGANTAFSQIIWGKKARVSPDLEGRIFQLALKWVDGYLFNLISGITATTKEIVADALAKFITVPGFTVGDLYDLLAPAFGNARAKRIGVTEATRMFMESGKQLADEVAQQGIEFVAVWRTSRDELVCPICGPLHGKKQGDGWFIIAPAHPNCRCSIAYEPIA